MNFEKVVKDGINNMEPFRQRDNVYLDEILKNTCIIGDTGNIRAYITKKYN